MRGTTVSQTQLQVSLGSSGPFIKLAQAKSLLLSALETTKGRPSGARGGCVLRSQERCLGSHSSVGRRRCVCALFDFGLVHHSVHGAACRCHTTPGPFLVRECLIFHCASRNFGCLSRHLAHFASDELPIFPPNRPEGPFPGSVTVYRIASPAALCLHKDSLGHRYRAAWSLGLPCRRVPQSGPEGARRYPWPWRGRNAAAAAGAFPGGTDTRYAARRNAEGWRAAGTRLAPVPRRPVSPARRAAALGTGSKLASAAGWADS